MELVNRIKNKLQSKKFWLVVSIFIVVSALYLITSWVMTLLQIIGEKTLVQLFDIAGSIFKTVIVTYCAVNLVQKVMNGDSAIGKFVSKITGGKGD